VGRLRVSGGPLKQQVLKASGTDHFGEFDFRETLVNMLKLFFDPEFVVGQELDHKQAASRFHDASSFGEGSLGSLGGV
jgi:hypothetical protein